MLRVNRGSQPRPYRELSETCQNSLQIDLTGTIPQMLRRKNEIRISLMFNILDEALRIENETNLHWHKKS